MVNSNRKLLFFDIDGTLLAGGIGGYIPKSAIRAIREAQENGHLCFINSGRTRSFFPPQLKEIHFDGFICGCGTEIIVDGEVIYKKELSKEVMEGIVPKAHQANMEPVAEGSWSCYHENRPDHLPGVMELLSVYEDISDAPTPLKTFDDELDFSKFIVVFRDGEGDVPLFQKLIAEDFEYIPREGFEETEFAEIVPLGCSKASGIDMIAERFGCSLDDCYVFGDSNNDLPMLNHVKNSVAMGNSAKEVLQQASYITDLIDRDGIYKALKHFELI